MKRLWLHKHKSESVGVGPGGGRIAREDPYATHFEQLTIPSFGASLRTSFRSLLGLEQRKR